MNSISDKIEIATTQGYPSVKTFDRLMDARIVRFQDHREAEEATAEITAETPTVEMDEGIDQSKEWARNSVRR